MKLYLLKNLNLFGGIFIAFSIPIEGTNILPKNYDYLFLPLGLFCMIVSYYYTFKHNKQ